MGACNSQQNNVQSEFEDEPPTGMDLVLCRMFSSQIGHVKRSSRTSEVTFNFICISDKDKNSRTDMVDANGNELYSATVQNGTMTTGREWNLQFTESRELFGNVSDSSHRGCELSDLVMVDNHIWSFDDRTGKVFEIGQDSLISVPIEGQQKLKVEWAFMKGEQLYYGSHMDLGRPATCQLVNMDPANLRVDEMADITPFTTKLYAALGINSGYMTMEAAVYDHTTETLVFFPRQLSKTPFNPAHANRSGSNLVIRVKWGLHETIADLNAKPLNVDTISITELNCAWDPLLGVSAIEWVPGREGKELVAIATTEIEEQGEEIIASYLLAFDLHGEVLMEPKKFPTQIKFEGLMPLEVVAEAWE